MNLDFILTTCPFCGCGCQFYLEALDGEIVGITPCKSDEISEGAPCIKGRNAYQFIHHEDRLTTPLLRRNGKLEAATWDEAMEVIALNLTQIKEKHGPESFGVFASAKCTNEENYVMQKFARAVLGTNNVDHCARL